MTTRMGWWDRLGAVAGIAFVGLSLVASSFLTNFDGQPGPDGPTASMFAEVNADHTIGESLSIVALFFFFWFLATYRQMLRRAEGPEGRFAWVAFGAGAAAGGLQMVTIQMHMALTAFETPTEAMRAPFAYLWMGSSALGAATAAMAGATAAIAFRCRMLPIGLGAFGLVVMLLCLSPMHVAGGMMVMMFMVWVLVMSVYMLVHALRRGCVGASEPTAPVMSTA